MDFNIKRNGLVFLYIFLVTIAFTTRYGDYTIGYTIQYVVSFLFIIICLLDYAKNRTRNADIDFKLYFKIYFIPRLVIHLYTIFLMLIGKVSWSDFVFNLSSYVPVLFALSSIYIFGKKSIKYLTVSLCLSWILSIVASLMLKGFAIFPHAILQAYFNPLDTYGGLTINYLELHDLVLSIGYVILYYLFVTKKFKKKEMLSILFILLIMILSVKRISVFGIIVSYLFILISRRVKNKEKFCKICGTILFFICYLVVYMIFNGSFEMIANKYGINLMARNYAYNAIVPYGKFNISFLGIGRNNVSKILLTEFSYLNLGGVHSDILKMYIENGFIMFGIWLWYYLIKLPKIFFKKFNSECGLLCFCLTVYSFVLYFTDNTETYFMCQLFSIIIPCIYSINKKKEESN